MKPSHFFPIVAPTAYRKLARHLCAHNVHLTNHIDFANVPSLSELWMWDTGQSGPLILTNLSSLTSVQVYDDGSTGLANSFTTAAFQGSSNLWDLELENIPTLTNLDVIGCATGTNRAASLMAQNVSLPTSVVDAVLTNLDASGLSGGSVDLSGTNNGVPSVAGLTAMHDLTNALRGWTVYWNGPPSTAPKISNVAGSPGSNSATITWTTDIPSDSEVYYGTTTSYGSVTTGNSNTVHSVFLNGLTTNSPYHFYVSSTSSGGTWISWDYQSWTWGAPAIYFVSTTNIISMQVLVNAGATVTWFWRD